MLIKLDELHGDLKYFLTDFSFSGRSIGSSTAKKQQAVLSLVTPIAPDLSIVVEAERSMGGGGSYLKSFSVTQSRKISSVAPRNETLRTSHQLYRCLC